MKEERLTLNVETEFAERVRAAAKRDGRTVSNWLTYVVSKSLPTENVVREPVDPLPPAPAALAAAPARAGVKTKPPRYTIARQ